MDSNILLNAVPMGRQQIEERLARFTEQFQARRQELAEQANKPPDGAGFGPTELGFEIARQLEMALASDPAAFTDMEALTIFVPPGSGLTPFFSNRAGELVIRVRQYTPVPKDLVVGYEATPVTPSFQAPEL